MRRTLSSGQTLLVKYVVPALFVILILIVAFLFVTNRMRDRAGAPLNPIVATFVVLAFIVGFWLQLRFSRRLMRVAMDDESLYVSDYQREIVVPLKDIADVTQNLWIRTHPITVRFKRETEFGNRIEFIPAVRWFQFYLTHPVVQELKDAAARSSAL